MVLYRDAVCMYRIFDDAAVLYISFFRHVSNMYSSLSASAPLLYHTFHEIYLDTTSEARGAWKDKLEVCLVWLGLVLEMMSDGLLFCSCLLG